MCTQSIWSSSSGKVETTSNRTWQDETRTFGRPVNENAKVILNKAIPKRASGCSTELFANSNFDSVSNQDAERTGTQTERYQTE